MKNTLAITKSLADGNRMRIVAALVNNDELCVCQIIEMLRVSGATVSRHMSILQNAGLVLNRKEGKWVYYRLSGSFPEKLRAWLVDSLWNSREIADDTELLKKIVSCAPEEITRRQKERNAGDVRPGARQIS